MHQYPPGLEPYPHQVEGLRQAWKHTEFAFFWKMGRGKTFATIQLAEARYNKGMINALIVLCPSPIKAVWRREFNKFGQAEREILIHEAGAQAKSRLNAFTANDKIPGLKVLIVGIEAMSQGNTWELVRHFADMHKAMVVCDESSKLKNPTSLRTKRITKVAASCLYRLALSGTPVTQGPWDLFGQFMFLNPKIIGCNSWTVFKARYCRFGGYKGKNIVGIEDLPALLDKIRPYCHVVGADEKLPPKIYDRWPVDITAEQHRLIAELTDDEEAEFDGELLITETVLERLTRYQQIIGGHFPFDIEGTNEHGIKRLNENPKLKAMMEYIEQIPDNEKCVIWARFVPEQEWILEALEEEYPGQAVGFISANDEHTNAGNVDRFLEDPNCRFMISSQLMGGMGQTWNVAQYVLYYSNSFSYEDRFQSEDRTWRGGITWSVLYLDFEAEHRYDRMILTAVGKKKNVADFIDEELKNG